jgi:hypothetical protein
VLTQCLAMAAVGAQAGAAAGPGGSDFVALAIAAGLVFIIVFVPYLIWNTLLAWFASSPMQFREGTVGNALKLSFLQLLLPAPMGILSGVGVYMATQQAMLGQQNAVMWGLIYAFCAGLIVIWLFSVLIAARIYSVSLLQGAVFNALLMLINVSLAFVIRLGGCLGSAPLPHG